MQEFSFAAFMPLIFLSAIVGIPLYFLVARKKGYTGPVWIICSFFPVINYFMIWIVIGMPDKILHEKMDRLLAEREQGKEPRATQDILM